MPKDSGALSSEAKLLEFLCGLAVQGPEQTDQAQVALAARIGLPVDSAVRIFGRTPAAMQKALERARARK